MKRAGRYCWAFWWLCLAVWLWAFSSAQAAARTYPIREDELTRFEQSLEALSSENAGQQTRLIRLQETLSASEEKLRASEKSSSALARRLERLSGELAGQQKSLENANRLLQTYEREERRTRARLERQRNLAWTVAALLALLAAAR
ncbi:MAG: hypothetical protein IJS96_05375 [Schwartzia sp.]|nr:hypothetical protein [Schwartzia sp. (in: firmicutes)]